MPSAGHMPQVSLVDSLALSDDDFEDEAASGPDAACNSSTLRCHFKCLACVLIVFTRAKLDLLDDRVCEQRLAV